MAATAADIQANTAKRLCTAAKAKTEQEAAEAAEAAHAHTHFPHHRDIVVGIHLLSLWKGLAANRSGPLLRTCNSTGSRTSSRRGGSSSRSRSGSSSRSSSLQETVLPACDLAVSLLKTWPPNIAGPANTTTTTSSSSSGVMPFPGAIPRSDVSGLALSVSKILLLAVQSELQPVSPDPPPSAADARYESQFSASAAVQHLLLLQTAFLCHLLHQQQQGLSPLKAKEAAAVVSGSKHLAAAAAAAEASAFSSSSASGVSQQQQQYPPVPAHHTAVLDMLLVPVDSINMQLPANWSSSADYLIESLATVSEFSLGLYASSAQQGGGAAMISGLPKVPFELCAPLHCMLAEAAALAPDGPLACLHVMMVYIQALSEVYFKVRVGCLLLSFQTNHMRHFPAASLRPPHPTPSLSLTPSL